MRVTNFVPRVLFGNGEFENLKNFSEQIFSVNPTYTVHIIDSIHEKTGLKKRLNPGENDIIVTADISAHEPKTSQIDSIRDNILKEKNGALPHGIIGIGGGSVMDIAKAVSVMLTNTGSSAEYQGWDLVTKPPVPKIAIPTLCGTGAEATRTAVLTGPEKKLGINSDHSIYDAILMDPTLLNTVPPEQEFYTGMDGFIHCVESINGSAMTPLGLPFARESKQAFENFFLIEKDYPNLMVGSFFGGCSVANSSVGVCHALSYGISWALGLRHGQANAVVFNQLEEYYGDNVQKFKEMVAKHKIDLPQGVCCDLSEETMKKMIDMTYLLKKDLISALGDDYKNILTPDKIRELYLKM